jgi:hypothetical protein
MFEGCMSARTLVRLTPEACRWEVFVRQTTEWT